MPGLIIRYVKNVGDAVKKGDDIHGARSDEDGKRSRRRATVVKSIGFRR